VLKRGLLLCALAIGLTRCGAHAQMVTGPDGYPALYIRCHGDRMDRCHRKAEQVCPYGYGLVSQTYGNLIVRCN
jgi:hypothetical protein